MSDVDPRGATGPADGAPAEAEAKAPEVDADFEFGSGAGDAGAEATKPDAVDAGTDLDAPVDGAVGEQPIAPDEPDAEADVVDAFVGGEDPLADDPVRDAEDPADAKLDGEVEEAKDLEADGLDLDLG